MSQWVAFKTIIIKEIRRYLRIWPQTLVPPAITMTLYFVIFGALIGSRIGSMDGFSYMEFVVPGLIMMAIINNSYANVVSSFYSAKFHHSIEEMLVSPVSNQVILMGYVMGGVSRGLLVAVVVTCVSMFFTELRVHNWGVMILVVMLTAILFSLAGFLNAIFANSFDDISIIPTFVLTPLTYLGGVFYSMSLLSEFWQAVSMANPIFYMVNAFRYGVLGVSDINVWASIMAISVFIAILYSVCITLLNRGTRIRQ